jgi:hypothetical protein
MKCLILLMAVLMPAFPIMAFGQSAQVSKPQEQTSQTTVQPQRPASERKGEAPNQLSRVDGDRSYRTNCSRCHSEPRRFPERQMATIMRHMRVRANLTAQEAQAILQYLTR